MLRIQCPYCGVRDEPEFTLGGPAHIARPSAHVSDLEWTSYLYHRENPKGLHHERWRHTYGCGRWFNLVRDTVSHQVRAVYRIGEPKVECTGEGSQ
jgi:sarcosine oxidase, subunit delta